MPFSTKPLALLGLLALAACGEDTQAPLDQEAGLDDLFVSPGVRDLAALQDLAVVTPGRDLALPAAADLGVSDLSIPAIPPDLAPPPDLATPPDLASPCGICPKNYTCGTANGIPVCRAPSGIPLFSHVFVILMENTSWSTLDKSNNTPFIHQLKSSWAYGNDYHGVTHPSLPNYIALMSGSPQGIECDCEPTGGACNLFNCNTLIHSCGCGQKVRNFADDLEAAGLTWRAYAEDMGVPCNAMNDGLYAVRHVPFLYFDSVFSDKNRCQAHVVDYTNFAADLPKANVFNFIAPNLTNDMHDPFPATSANLANGDAWLAKQIPPILASAAWKQNGLLVVVWDEDDLSGVLAKDDPIPIFVMSPLAKNMGFGSNVKADHYSLLATFEDGLNLPRLGMAAGAKPLGDYFPVK